MEKHSCISGLIFFLAFSAIVPDRADAAITITATVTNVSGPAIHIGTGIVYNGAINASATGGTAPYTYGIRPNYVINNGYFPELPAGIYTVTATDATGQQASITVTIANVYPQPTVSISGIIQPSGCNTTDASFTLTGAGGTPPYTYSIDGGYTFTSNNVFSHLTQGAYEVLIRDANGQLARLTVNPTSQYSPDILLSGPDCLLFPGSSPQCIASCVNTGSVAITIYSYTAVDSFSLDGIHYRQIPPIQNFAYNVYQYDSTGLAPGLYNFYLKEGMRIDISAVVSDQYCYVKIDYISIDASCGHSDGGFQVLASNGYPPYSYSIDGVNYQSSNTFTGLSSGSYNVTVRDIEGITTTATATVFNKCPAVTVTSTNDICNQHNGSITATGQKGTLPYRFSIDGTNFQSGNIFNNLSAGNYTVTIKDALGFKSTATATIAAWCLSVTGIPSNSECGNPNGTITATAAGGQTPYAYSLDGANFHSSNLFTGLSAGNYTLTAKDGAGNIASSGITITNLPGPTITVTSQPAFCDNTGGGISIQASGGTVPYQYSIDGVNYQTGNSFNLVPGSYTAWVKDAIGCTATLPATVNSTNNLTLDPGIPPTICEGKSAILAATSNGVAYQWSPTTGLSNPAALQPTANPSTTTTYTCTAAWGSCQRQSSVTVTVNPAPTPNAGQDTTVCYGQSIQLTGAGGVSYTWSPATDLDNPSIPNPIVEKPDRSITYQLSVTDQNGCASLQPSAVTVRVTAPAELSAGNDTSILTGDPLQLQTIDVNHSGFTTYNWTPTTGLSNPSIANPTATITSGITYTVTAETPAGCEASATVTIEVYYSIGLFVPTAFTPNGDGHNDVLKVIPYGIRRLRYFAVFNRWGQRIFYTENPSQGWDGTLDSRPQPSGPYVWIAAGIDLNGRFLERKGSAMLIR